MRELYDSSSDDDVESYVTSKSVFRREDTLRGGTMVSLREAFPDSLDHREEENIDVGDERLFRLFCDVKEGINNPSIFLIKSLAIARNSWQLDCLALLVFFFQAWFPTWFACVVLHRKNFTMIAPGFHNRVTGPLRTRWLHRFSIDLASFCFLSYIAWSTWQQRQLHIFRFYLRADGVRIRRDVLVLGMFTNIVAIFSVVFLTYLLFRIEPDIHEILLNAVALDFIHKFDQTVCSTFLHHTKLHLLLRRAKSELIDEADRIIQRGALGDIATLRSTTTFGLLQRPFTIAKFGELVLRYVRRIYIVSSCTLLVFALTGGHVGHTHFINVLWYFHLVEHRAKSESTTRLKFLVRNKSKDPDTKYAFVAIFVTSIILVIVFTVGKVAIYHCYGPQDDVFWFNEDNPTFSERRRRVTEMFDNMTTFPKAQSFLRKRSKKPKKSDVTAPDDVTPPTITVSIDANSTTQNTPPEPSPAPSDDLSLDIEETRVPDAPPPPYQAADTPVPAPPTTASRPKLQTKASFKNFFENDKSHF